MLSIIVMGKLQQKSDNLKEAILQLTAANEQLREDVKEYEVGTIERYPDLEITSIDTFLSDLEKAAKALLVAMGRVVETLDRLAEVEDEEDTNPEREVQAGAQEAQCTRQLPAFRSENMRRSTILPSPAGRAREPVNAEVGEAVEPRLTEVRMHRAVGGLKAGARAVPPSGSLYTATYAEEVRQEEMAEQKRRINKDRAEAWRARESKTRGDDQVEEARNRAALSRLPLTSTLRMSGLGSP